MMLRTTFSRTSKACSLGFVPRALRDDFCNGPASHAVIGKAHKSTKSTEDGPGPTEKKPDVPILQTTCTDTVTGIPLTRREKCQKIIDQAFGTASTEPDRVSNEQYCSHTVNIEATRREMEEAENERIKLQEQNMKVDNPLIPDDRQYGIFKMAREQIQIGDDKDEITAEENTAMKASETLVVNEKLVNSLNMASAREPHLKLDGFEKIQELNLDCTEVDHSQEIEEKLHQKLETIEETPLVETQRPRIEGFNENPIVLGDQLNPALTCKSISVEKQGNFQERDPSGTYDEVAKRCLKHPFGQIDEILVKEMDKIGLPLTCEPDNKTPSTLMGDELVQMDVCNENKQQKHQEIYPQSAELGDDKDERGNIPIMSPNLIHHMFSHVRLPDLNEQAEKITLLKSEDIEPVKEDGVPYPDQIKKEIKTVFCDEYEDQMDKSLHKSPSKEINMNQSIQQDIEQDWKPNFVYTKPNVHQHAPEVTPTDIESMQAFHSSTFKQATGRFTSELNDRNVVGKNTEAKNGTPHTAESVMPAINLTNVTSDHLVSHEPENNSNYKEVRRPSHYGTINLAEYDQRLLAEREVENKNSYSRYLASTYAWGEAKDPFATKVTNKNEVYFNESGEVECYRQTPEFQPKTMEEQAVPDESRNAPTLFVERVNLNTEITLPDQNWNRNIENSPNEDKVEDLEPEKVSLPEALMKEHELDPYYVLTCNETCPISPGSSMSACKNSDFVDTTDTIYLKKNIYESIRPKQMRNTKSKVSDKINISESEQLKLDRTHLIVPQTENVVRNEVDFELLPETTPKIEDLPNIKPTVASPEHPSLQSSQQVTLTELLKRVRQRNRTQYIRDLGVQVDPNKGECKKSPRCQPTGPRSPPSEPIPPPPFGLPMMKKNPKICKPRKGGSSKKCAACDIDVTCGVQLGEIYPKIAYELDQAEACAAISRVDLTEVILENIQTLGRMVGAILRQVKSNVEALLAREYDPWTPIPSWPVPKKEEKKCEKPCHNWTPGISGAPPCVRGCPVFPKARASMNPEPPCNPKPCEGFPKRTSFSTLDYIAVLLETNEVYDLGQY